MNAAKKAILDDQKEGAPKCIILYYKQKWPMTSRNAESQEVSKERDDPL